jgi:two-component system cell cycle response regulator
MQFNVLLIGQDSKQTELYANLIRDLVDCHIDVFTRAESATRWLSQVRYHIVVIDSQNALPLLEKIKREHPESSVVVISDHPSIEEGVKTMRLGAEDYLKKPVHLDAFRLAIRRGIGRRTLFEDDGVYSRYLNLVNSCQMISASLEENRVFSILRSFLTRELKASHSWIFKTDAKGKLEPAENDKDQGVEEIIEIALKAAKIPDSLYGDEFCKFVDKGPMTPGIFAMRFRCSQENDLFFVCLSPKKPEPLAEFEGRLKILRAQTEVTGQNILRYRDVQEMAYVDDLTGLHNTRYLGTVLDREIEKAQKLGTSFAVMFMDADKFKLVNDKHGHLAGSKLLTELGHKFKTFVRDNDSIVRYGGDEFVAILSSCDLEGAKQVAERIRKSIEKHVFLKSEGLDLKITVSIGVAVFPDHAQSKDDIIEAADNAMYCAKNASRNSVFVAMTKKEDHHV